MVPATQQYAVRASEGTQINNIYPDAVRVRVYGAVPVVGAVLPC